MKNIDISVVIGSFNQAKVLEKVLNAFNQQNTSISFEVIVCDSGSTDGSHELFKNFQANFIFRSFIKENQGKAAARNLGIEKASAPIVLITDSDMIPDPSLISSHYQAHKQIKQPACFEGCTYNLTHYHYPIIPSNTFPYIRKQPKAFSKVGWHYFLTGNVSAPTDLLRQNNAFDEHFSNYGWEDLELGYRIIKKEKNPLYYLPQAINYHYHVISKQDDITRCKLKGESAKLFLQKHPELKQFLGIHSLSHLGHSINKNFPGFFQWFYTKGLKAKTNVLRDFSFWYCRESQYWEGLFSA